MNGRRRVSDLILSVIIFFLFSFFFCCGKIYGWQIRLMCAQWRFAEFPVDRRSVRSKVKWNCWKGWCFRYMQIQKIFTHIALFNLYNLKLGGIHWIYWIYGCDGCEDFLDNIWDDSERFYFIIDGGRFSIQFE